MTTKTLPGVNPFGWTWNGEWHPKGNWTSGHLIDLDAAEGPASRTPGREVGIREDQIDEVIAAWETDVNGYDGEVAALVRLKDGRYVSWESWWGPTGNGFSEDAYGGDSDAYISTSLERIVAFGLTDDGRRALGLA